MKKYLFILALLIALCAVYAAPGTTSNSATVVTIGEGTNNSNYPFNSS